MVVGTQRALALERARAKAEAEAQEKADALAKLREILEPVDTIWCVLQWINRDGDNRAISLLVPVIERADTGPRWCREETLTIVDLTYLMARADMGTIRRGSGGILTRGGGADMGFHLVYNLCRDLGPYRCQGDRCLSNTHVNDGVPRDGEAEHTDGYRFRHRWI